MLVLGLGALTVLMKAAGVLIVGDRDLQPDLLWRLDLLAPALFSALVLTQTFVYDGDIVVDARLGGVAVGGALLASKAPLWAGVLAAALATSGLRAAGFP